ncbi:SAV_915 family protein [Streptomyces capillispiralis]|uniref:SAV_915 family protein n=1 Tax=Streptomyces capillispiralis TaxID=68182 RepID=UPI0036B7CE75
MVAGGTPGSDPEYLVLPTTTMNGFPLTDDTVEVTLLPLTGVGGQERLVALAFTSVALLVEAMGEEQPWVVLPAGEVGEALTGSRAEAVLVDPRPAVGADQGGASWSTRISPASIRTT